VPSAADALGVLRLLVAAVFPAALARARMGGWVPGLLFAVAAGSDFLDGIAARHGSGPTAHGAVLDNLADIAFVVAGTGAAASLGIVPVGVPVAIGCAFAAYAFASIAGRRTARSRVGHAAGVLNYALVGLIAGAAGLPGRAWRPILSLASTVVVAVNLAALLGRVVPGFTPAREPRAGGTRARSPHSSA
jgi:phosphatidylglycerophosphate synthase